MEIGATVLPHFPKDTTDRNRTSPFAFTGNKFEFRMLGSTVSIAEPNIVLNTVVAEALSQFADALESSKDFIGDVAKLVKKTIHDHKRIIFNGNNYAEEWVEEAERRGLSNLKNTPEALGALMTENNVKLFTKNSVYTEKELESRHEIFLENYAKTINIEALTMIDLANKRVVPAVVAYENDLADLLLRKSKLGGHDSTLEDALLSRVSKLAASLSKKLAELEEETVAVRGIADSAKLAAAYRERVFSAMNELRAVVDELELITPAKYWPLPSYGEILYSVI
jgi:glutamine synthetase